MRPFTLQIIITFCALLFALIHIIYPNIKIDYITLILLLVAILPWFRAIIKSMELPGGFKIEFQDLEKAKNDAIKVGLLGTIKQVQEEPLYITIAEHDPNLALAGLRMEIEKRLRDIAKKKGIDYERQGIGQLLRSLTKHQILLPEVQMVISDLISLLNNAVHGADVDKRAYQWAIDVGPRLLSGLDNISNNL